MSGPAGYGTASFVSDVSVLPYQITYENDPSATAPAQRVDITDPLDPNFDWTTFQLTAVGFGSTYLAIPAGLNHYDTTVNGTLNGVSFAVVIRLNLDPVSGIFTASFQSIDPNTNLPPASLLTGFLPPEDGSGRGTGFVSFTIRPKAGLTTGTQIRNVASITFDRDQSIATDQVSDQDPSQGIDPAKQVLVTIDSGLPTSSVHSLSTFSPASFTVMWAGQDDSGDSGVATYDVYVSDDGGPFTLWQLDAAQTSAKYTGQDGHTYRFYSIATDNVGNDQPTPTAGQATTQVDATPPTSSVAALPAFSPGSFTLQWAGSDNSGGSGLATYSIFVSEDGGMFQPLLTGTKQTSTNFTGQSGHTYGFYSVATDSVGNVQPAPSAAQTTTRVDTVAPTSSVKVLPIISLPSFTVTWSGQDDPGGSGLRYFDLYVSDNGGAFTLVPGLSHTTQTSTIFNGQINHTYAFRTIATDNAGNVETKTQADTQTQTPVFQNSTLTEAENTAAPPSLAISTLLGTHYSDADRNTKPGIAVTFTSGNGSWQYQSGTS
jgi:hypothetical protein